MGVKLLVVIEKDGKTARKTDKSYIEGKEWKCDDSPTGAHYWKETRTGSDEFRCQYCGELRQY